MAKYFVWRMQQTTINLPSTNPVRALTGLARQIALPGEYAPERFPSFPALERTAVMAFTQPTTWAVPAGATYHGMVCRQASYPLWLDTVQSPTNQKASYHAIWQSTALAEPLNNGEVSFKDAPLYSQATGSTSPAVTQIGVTSGTPLFGQSWAVLGVDDSCGPSPFIYVPPGCYCFVACYASSALTAGTYTMGVTLERWMEPGKVEYYPVEPFSFTAGTTGGISDNQGLGGYWVRPVSANCEAGTGAVPAIQLYAAVIVANSTGVYTGSATTGGTWVMNAQSQAITAMMPATVPSEFSTSTLPWSDTRLTASAALLTNVTQVLNKNGTVMAGRVSPNTVSPWLVTKSTIAALHPAEKAFLPLETGLYTYCPPSTDMANFWDYRTTAVFPYTGVAAAAPVYRLDNTSLVNHFFMDSTVASSFAVSMAWHVEFRTSSALFQIALSGLTLEALHGAQLALAAAGFFFENPEHDSVLSKVIAGAKKIAPHLMSVAELHPAGKAAVTGVKAVASALSGPKKVNVPNGPKRVQPTSAQGSGIVPKKGKKGKQKGQQRK